MIHEAVAEHVDIGLVTGGSKGGKRHTGSKHRRTAKSSDQIWSPCPRRPLASMDGFPRHSTPRARCCGAASHFPETEAFCGFNSSGLHVYFAP
ncbi:hypothetical protein Ga0080559_TMP1983 [Salipiger profundus]|uniref:Uncharacterized protein n=1 Tax=Salipiger profundus TaxID=1229727 RepID=A0A1U7D3Q7_9RHOB|nr:hypothetical protein Ga0080559_TMP1983 [Salipiger profundus]